MRAHSIELFGAAASVVVVTLLVIAICFSSPLLPANGVWPSQMCVTGSRLAHARFGFDFGALPVHRYAAVSSLAAHRHASYIPYTHRYVCRYMCIGKKSIFCVATNGSRCLRQVCCSCVVLAD